MVSYLTTFGDQNCFLWSGRIRDFLTYSFFVLFYANTKKDEQFLAVPYYLILNVG